MTDVLALLRDDPGDAIETRLVHADQLQLRGDPRGKLIAIQCAAEGRADAELSAEADALVAAIEASIALPASVRLTWRLGFVDAVDLGATTLDRGATWLDHPAFALVRALTLGAPRTAVTVRCLETFAPTLRRLTIGSRTRALAKATLEAIARLPQLQHLVLAGSTLGTLAPLLGLRLQSLELRTRALTSDRLAEISRLPLRHLVLELRASAITLDDLAPILDGSTLPPLEHLGVLDTTLAAQVVDGLALRGPHTHLRSFAVTPAPIDALERNRAGLAHLAVASSDDGAAAELATVLAEGLGRYDEALAFYARARARAPTDRTLTWKEAIALRRVGRSAEAVARWDEIIAAAPTAPALRNRHLALRALARHAEARADLVRGLELRPQAWNLWCEIGDIDYELGHFDSAIAAYRKSLTEAPDEALPRRGLARSLVAAGRELDEARALLDALEPDGDADLAVCRGQAWLAADPRTALDAFASVETRDASDDDHERARLGAALARLALGEPAARGVLEQAPAPQIALHIVDGLVALAASDEGTARRHLRSACPQALEPEAIAATIASEQNARRPRGAPRIRLPGSEPPPRDWVADQIACAIYATLAAGLLREPLEARVAAIRAWLVARPPYHLALWSSALPLVDAARPRLSADAFATVRALLFATAWPEHALRS